MSLGCIQENMLLRDLQKVANRRETNFCCFKVRLERMCETILYVLILLTLSSQLSVENDMEVAASCPGDQRAFRGSCFELVALRRSFLRAQDWCEESGGHLAFISDQDTQMFLEKHMDSNKDMWIGLAPSCSPNKQLEGLLSWLDGSPVTFSKWVSSPQPGAGCGHILRNSHFQWEATGDCSHEMHFICQFEPGRRIICSGHNTSLRCGSGQALMIDGGFYTHYCRSRFSAAAVAHHECSWVDVVHSIKAKCQGQQICQMTEVMKPLDELCPELKSYLTVDFHCKDAVFLSMKSVAAVSEDVTITVRLFLHFSTCKLKPGEGQDYHLYIPNESESSVVHIYTRPATFHVVVECTNSETRVSTQRIITIQEPVAQIGVIRCFAGNVSFSNTTCRALYGEAIQIQMEVKAGTDVVYRIQSEDRMLAGASVVRGNVSQNITVNPETVKQLGPGCHLLTLYASNMVTFPEASANLQVCVLEKLSGLQASILRGRDVCSGSPCFSVDVSLYRGEPALLRFSLTGDTHSYAETKLMTTKREIFHITHSLQGKIRVKIKAWNVFSSQEIDVFGSSDENSVTKLNSLNEHLFSFNKKTRKQHARVVRSTWVIKADPSDSVNKYQPITLSAQNEPDGIRNYNWKCNSCSCTSTSVNPTWTIDGRCLPDPFHFYKYYLTLKVNQRDEGTQTICLTLTPELDGSDKVSLSCSDGCPPGKNVKDATFKLSCDQNACSNVLWYIRDFNGKNTWDAETKDCYVNTNNIPLINKQNGNNQYKVTKEDISNAMSQNKDITVVVTYTSQNQPVYKYYVIQTSSSSPTTQPPTPKHPNPTTTTKRTTVTTTRTTLKSTTKSPDGLSCVISPLSGTILDSFSIICTTEVACPRCQYCFESGDKNLLCSKDSVVKSVFLPHGDSSSNYNLLITATAKAGSHTASTTLTVQVSDFTPSSDSENSLNSAVSNSVDQLKKQGLLSGATVGELINSVAQSLNSQSNEMSKDARQNLRKQMLNTMIDTVSEAPPTTPEETQVVARGLTTLTEKGDELSLSTQAAASTLFTNLSLSIMSMNVSTAEDEQEVITAASIIMEGLSNILEYLSDKNTSDALLEALTNTQSALLKTKATNDAPTVIEQPHISLYVSRVTPESLYTQSLGFTNSSYPSFSLPALPSDLLPSEEPVDVRMLSLDKNPFSWNQRGNISGLIGALSLTTKDGSRIPVENLSDDIEILLPRPAGDQVNTSVLDLGNFSTTAIDVPSAESTLLLKMVPSVDPLPFKLFLGYMNYPTQTNYVAMTEMPLQGTTQEERYTWILDPATLKGNTGRFYLVVMPIVGPGIKSINATLSITPITSSCKFWNESQLEWKDSGCKVGVKTTPSVTQCLCNHLTFFGSSFFVTPNLVDPSRTAQLFATFAQNPVVVCFVGALFVTYFLVVVWARRKDIRDTAKLKVTVLEDNNPLDNNRYLLRVCTGRRIGASTSSQVVVTLLGGEGNSQPHHLTDPKKPLFDGGAVDLFLLTTPLSLGELQGIRLWHNNSGSHPAWYVGSVMVQDLQTQQNWYFLCNSWLAIDKGDCSLDQVFPVSTEMDRKKFSNLFFMKTAKDFSDGHLWFSVVSRPPSSTFTCVQRVSCCFSLLLCTMLTSIMFYGIPTDPSEQVMDLGHFQFTWQQFMIGVQSSLIMFPINILIVSIFRNTHPRQEACCQNKRKKTKSLQSESTQQTGSNTGGNLDNILKDITRVISSAKSNILYTQSEFGPGTETQINAVLSQLEDFIKQNYKTSHNTLSKGQLPAVAQLPVEGIQKQSNKTQHLYKQLCCLEKELNELDPSNFSSPDRSGQALQRLQNMKKILKEQLFTNPVCRSSPADCTSGDLDQRKKACGHGGLPWWFIIVGWLLVIATSVISGYFTMLYGLKFGKARSISWLISMIVSFFQSLLFIQPVKVILLAVFFALVIKKVDEEDFQNVVLEKSERQPGDENNQQIRRRGDRLYEPPSPADVERMKRKRMMELKAFALLTEVLTYLFFMWLLLLVAYGQKDPNAFFLNQHITSSFTGNIPGVMSLQDVFTWANTSLLPNLFGEYPGFITDGNSKLVGNARLRQLRVQNSSCQVAGSMLKVVADCNALYSWEEEDMGSFGPGWNPSMRGNVSSSPWTYQTQSKLRSHPFWGRLEFYRGGGYVAELGPDLQHASGTLEYLFSNEWLDVKTRAIFVEFTVYNANVNLFCIVTFLMETAAVGVFQFYSELQDVCLYQTMDGLYVSVMVAEIIYLLLILHYMFQQGKLVKQQRWNYFKNKWNLLELSIILLSWSAVAVFIKRTLLRNRDLTFYQNNKNQFTTFHDSATADSMFQYLIAFLVLLTTVKLWHLLRLNHEMNLLIAALQRAMADVYGFLVIVIFVLVAYAVASNIMYGWKFSSFKTFTDSLLTLFRLLMGIFNYEVLNDSPLLGGLLFGSCIILKVFLLLHLLLSVICLALKEERAHHKPSEEEEIVDLLLSKICNLLGSKREKESVGVGVNGGGDSVLNNSRNVLNSSSAEVNIYQKPGNFKETIHM